MGCASKASLALQAYFQTPPDSCASLLIAPARRARALAYPDEGRGGGGEREAPFLVINHDPTMLRASVEIG